MLQLCKTYVLLFLLLCSTPFVSIEASQLEQFKYGNKMYFATACDTEYFYNLPRLIDSICKFHSAQLGEIAVFDLGLTKEQKNIILKNRFVKIYRVEKVNPYIFTKIKTNNQGRMARGLFSWKPVVIKQALDMFPIVFYIDSGLYLNGPLDLLFEHVKQNGYLLVDCGHSIGVCATNPVKQKFGLNTPEGTALLNERVIAAGFQGLSRSVYNTYVMPMYELAKDINNFVDDGSAPWGYGGGRHDQTLFSIVARRLNLHVTIIHERPAVIIPLQLHINGEDVTLKNFKCYMQFKW